MAAAAAAAAKPKPKRPAAVESKKVPVPRRDEDDDDDEGDDADDAEDSKADDDEDDEGDDYDKGGDDATAWQLGFVEPPLHPMLMRRHYFPSKVGGKPAWLNPRDIPRLEELSCDACSKPLRFLLQLYATLDDDEKNAESNFHRTVYVFVCPRGCIGKPGSLKVFRNNLARVNPFYSARPSPKLTGKEPITPAALDDAPWQATTATAAAASGSGTSAPAVLLCAVCGLPGPKQCGECRRSVTHAATAPSYCTVEHQQLHWKAVHKPLCARNAAAAAVAPAPAASDSKSNKALREELWEEQEILIEDEEWDEDPYVTKTKAMMAEYEKEQSEMSAKDRAEEDKAFVEEQWSPQRGAGLDYVKQDNFYVAFHERTSRGDNSAQVIRYNKTAGAIPLWVHTRGQLVDPVKKASAAATDAAAASLPELVCPRCKGPRQFEFQILPQLLHFLSVDTRHADNIDWGTLCVYTCAASCGDGSRPPASASTSATASATAAASEAAAAGSDIDGADSRSAYVREFIFFQPMPADEADASTVRKLLSSPEVDDRLKALHKAPAAAAAAPVAPAAAAATAAGEKKGKKQAK